MHRQHASVAGTRAHARGACALIAFATSVLACALGPNTVHADPALRTQMDLRGNFVLFGATLAQDCASGVPAPVVGTIGNCPDDNLAAPDIYWRADDPSPGSARADANISSDDARATAVLEPEPPAPAPCSPAWLSLKSGPSDRRYRELCPDEITGKALAPPGRAKPEKQLERMLTPSHPASADHLVDPRAVLAERPLSIGE